MSELEEKLEGILGNPQAMAQIMSLAQSLNLGGNQPSAGDAAPPAKPADPPPSASDSAPASGGGTPDSGLEGLLNGLNPEMLSAAASLMGQYASGRDDERTALLRALRPFVKEQRYAKLDKAIQIAKLSRLIRSGVELFRTQKERGKPNGTEHESGKEDGHV